MIKMLYILFYRTVEINNTDAEGRLVLGDGVERADVHVESLAKFHISQVAYARKDLKADIVVDMATLTGAQVIKLGD